jgi:hypothetical protein
LFDLSVPIAATRATVGIALCPLGPNGFAVIVSLLNGDVEGDLGPFGEVLGHGRGVRDFHSHQGLKEERSR